jgi:alkanesulfonate monooxygenase
MSREFLWYISNQVIPGHRGEPVTPGHNSLDTLAARTDMFELLIAVRPGY